MVITNDAATSLLRLLPGHVSVKVYRRDVHGLWTIEKYDDLERSVDLPEINSSVRLRDIYDTLEPQSRPRLQVVQEPESKPKP